MFEQFQFLLHASQKLPTIILIYVKMKARNQFDQNAAAKRISTMTSFIFDCKYL